MRIWSDASPAILTRDDLGREHRHIHEIAQLLKEGGSSNEVAQFWLQDAEHRRALIFRHELVRLALNYRYPMHHRRGRHPTPMKQSALNENQMWCLRNFARQLKEAVSEGVPISMYANVHNNQFIIMIKHADFPRDPIYTETPWLALGMSLGEYVRQDGYWPKDLKYRAAEEKRIKSKRRR